MICVYIYKLYLTTSPYIIMISRILEWPFHVLNMIQLSIGKLRDPQVLQSLHWFLQPWVLDAYRSLDQHPGTGKETPTVWWFRNPVKKPKLSSWHPSLCSLCYIYTYFFGGFHRISEPSPYRPTSRLLGLDDVHVPARWGNLDSLE